MIKELTEQWRNGELTLGTYYIVNENGVEEIDKTVAIGEFWNNPDLKEVLASVPTYDQFVELTEKADQFSQLVKKVEKLEKQLKEAENVIQLYFKNTQNATYKSLGMNDGYYKKAFIHAVAKEYLEKWGVK